MNSWTWWLLAALLAISLLDFAALLLNLQTLRRPLPESFSGIYDQAEYRRLQDYTAANARVELFESAVSLAALLVFWLAGGYGWLDQLIRSLGFAPIISGLLFMGALALGSRLLAVPFDIYSTFRVEERFGFNRSTPALFLSDLAKSLVLGVVLGGGLLAVVLAVFEFGGPLAWLYGWGAVALLTTGLSYVAPAVILPLFNKFTPLEDGELKTAVLDYCHRNHFPLAGLFVIDGSKRSSKSNAFFTGFGRMKKVALFDTLIANHTVPELVAVLAHEVGHYKLRHILKHLTVAMLNLGLFLYLASVFIQSPTLFEAFGIAQPSVYAGLAIFMVFYTPLSRVLSAFSNALSRKHEFEADRFAAETTGHPEAMIQALEKLSRGNLSNLEPHWLHVALYHSHPPVLERIAALRR